MEYDYKKPHGSSGVRDVLPNPRSIPKEERPRERLIRLGPESLSDQDLLSVVLVSGIKGKNVTRLAQELLTKLDSGKTIPPVKELCLLAGMGESKACAVAAMLEFGRRRWASGQKIRYPMDIYNLVRHHADKRQ